MMMKWAKGWGGAVNRRGVIKRGFDTEMSAADGTEKVQVWFKTQSPNMMRPTRRVHLMDLDQAKIFREELDKAIAAFEEGAAKNDS